MKNIPVLFNNKKECCGCGVCVALCPKEAINMEQDTEGFFYPKIDMEKCICCEKCITICAFKIDMKGK